MYSKLGIGNLKSFGDVNILSVIVQSISASFYHHRCKRNDKIPYFAIFPVENRASDVNFG